MLMSGDFAGYAGVSERTAQRNFARGHWIGHRQMLHRDVRMLDRSNPIGNHYLGNDRCQIGQNTSLLVAAVGIAASAAVRKSSIRTPKKAEFLREHPEITAAR